MGKELRRVDDLNLTPAWTNSVHSYRVMTHDEPRPNLKQSSEFLQWQEASLALRILIIEDDEKIGATLMEVLTHEGYSATLSRTGEDGFFRWSTDSFDLVTRKVERAGKRVDLTAREFDLLEFLVRHAHSTVSRDMLAHEIWKDVGRATPLDNVIDVHIARLRRKIDGPDLARLIHTVRGVGFCLGDSDLD